MTSKWPDNFDAITWIVISNSLDIGLINGDIHGRSYKKKKHPRRYCSSYKTTEIRTFCNLHVRRPSPQWMISYSRDASIYFLSGIIMLHTHFNKTKPTFQVVHRFEIGLDIGKLQWNMMTSSHGNIPCYLPFVRGIHRSPIRLTKASDAGLWCFFYLCLNELLSKQSIPRWFETPLRSLWRHCYDVLYFL